MKQKKCQFGTKKSSNERKKTFNRVEKKIFKQAKERFTRAKQNAMSINRKGKYKGKEHKMFGKQLYPNHPFILAAKAKRVFL